MATRLTILVENTVPGKSDGLYAEHGFSVFIERADIRLLFDTGPQGIALLHNAPHLEVDLRRADAIVLSHGHGDHTGGLAAVLFLIGREIPVYGHPGIFAQRYGRRRGGEIRYAGLPFAREALEANGARFDLRPEFRAIAPGVYLTGEIPRRHDFERGDARLFVRQNGTETQDPFTDDQSLVLETQDGLALVLGCCHAGLVNTIDHVRNRLPGKPVHTVIGGTHLGFAPPDQLQQTIEALRALELKRLGLSHCTGLEAGARLAAALGDRVMFCNVGTSLILD
jgi:7,8-dihydropterin-6-yl-methyl-4-(beta-D-ribofuranosyl)aminobenzene 5'-phosphate synthase